MIIASPTLSWRMNSVKWPWTTVPLLVIRPTPCKIVICGGSSEDCRETSSVASRLLFVPDRLLDVPPDDEEVDDLTALGFSPLKESFPRTTLPYEDIFDLIYIFQQNICVPFSVNHKPTIKSLLTLLTDKQLELFALYAPLLSKRVLSKHFINRSASEAAIPFDYEFVWSHFVLEYRQLPNENTFVPFLIVDRVSLCGRYCR